MQKLQKMVALNGVYIKDCAGNHVCKVFEGNSQMEALIMAIPDFIRVTKLASTLREDWEEGDNVTIHERIDYLVSRADAIIAEMKGEIGT